MSVLTPTAAVNAAIADARTLPALIDKLSAVDPSLAVQLTSKPLLASRTPWGTVAAGAVGWVSARYGLGFDDTTTALIAGLFVLLASYAMRLITRQPVSGLLTAAPAPTVADLPPPAPPTA